MAQSVLPQSLPQETSHYNRSPISLIEGNGHLAHFGYQIYPFWLCEARIGYKLAISHTKAAVRGQGSDSSDQLGEGDRRQKAGGQKPEAGW